jgi:hypothetical protein
MYADDCTHYTSAPTASELTETLRKELYSVSELVNNNKLTVYTSKTKIIVFGSMRSLRLESQLEMHIKGVTIELKKLNP